MTPTTALLRFHLASGARLAMRAGVPAAAFLTVAIGLSEAPGLVLQQAARDLAGPAGSPVTPLVLAAIGAGIAGWGAPRIAHGVDGWMRHLPASSPAHGAGLTGALVAAQAPVAVAWAGLWVLAWSSGAAVDPRRLAALPVVLAGVACLALPTRRRFAIGALGLAAVVMALVGGWAGVAGGALVVAAAVRLYVPHRTEIPAASAWRTSRRAWAIPARIASRAAGKRTLGVWVPALLLLGIGALIVENNPGSDVGRPVRMIGALAVAAIVAGRADLLAARRPPWRWARSLPWSAGDRVLHDAIWLATHALVVPVVVGVLLDPVAGLTTLLTVPLLALRGAAMLRRHHTASGISGRVLAEGAFLGLCLMLSPWVILGAAILAWPAWNDAVKRDRDLDVSRWSPREHLAVGDPASWSGG